MSFACKFALGAFLFLAGGAGASLPEAGTFVVETRQVRALEGLSLFARKITLNSGSR